MRRHWAETLEPPRSLDSSAALAKRARCAVPAVTIALASSMLGGGCAALVGLDDLVQTEPTQGLTEPDEYRFTRGAAEFRVEDGAGVLLNDAGEALLATEGRHPTARGGRVQMSAQGGFVYTPPGGPGDFLGDDSFEYTLKAGALREPGRVSLTVHTQSLSVSELALSRRSGFGIIGTEGSLAGASAGQLAMGGDFNGDGLDDLLVGLRPTGTDMVAVFGKASEFDLDLGGFLSSTPRGFVVRETAPGGVVFARSMASAGDVNGDGLDDLVLGTPNMLSAGSIEASASAGRAYVVFGRPRGGPHAAGRGRELVGSRRHAPRSHRARGVGPLRRAPPIPRSSGL